MKPHARVDGGWWRGQNKKKNLPCQKFSRTGNDHRPNSPQLRSSEFMSAIYQAVVKTSREVCFKYGGGNSVLNFQRANRKSSAVRIIPFLLLLQKRKRKYQRQKENNNLTHICACTQRSCLFPFWWFVHIYDFWCIFM